MSTNIQFYLSLSQDKRNAIDVYATGVASSERERIQISQLFTKHVRDIQESILSHRLAGILISGPKEKWTSQALAQICPALRKLAQISVQNRLIHQSVKKEKDPLRLEIDQKIALKKENQAEEAHQELRAIMRQTALEVIFHPENQQTFDSEKLPN